MSAILRWPFLLVRTQPPWLTPELSAREGGQGELQEPSDRLINGRVSFKGKCLTGFRG